MRDDDVRRAAEDAIHTFVPLINHQVEVKCPRDGHFVIDEHAHPVADDAGEMFCLCRIMNHQPVNGLIIVA